MLDTNIYTQSPKSGIQNQDLGFEILYITISNPKQELYQ